MRRPQRLIAAAVLIALSGALAGCGSTAGFDPTDMLDFLDTKKKLPGDRKPVFPEGVPGLEQGVPKDLYRGARPAGRPERAGCRRGAAAGRGAEIQARREVQGQAGRGPRCRARRIPMPRPRRKAAPPPRRRAPKPAKIVRKRTTAPPPDQSAAQPRASRRSSPAIPGADAERFFHALMSFYSFD